MVIEIILTPVVVIHHRGYVALLLLGDGFIVAPCCRKRRLYDGVAHDGLGRLLLRVGVRIIGAVKSPVQESSDNQGRCARPAKPLLLNAGRGVYRHWIIGGFHPERRPNLPKGRQVGVDGNGPIKQYVVLLEMQW
jgi:hypothetical protein